MVTFTQEYLKRILEDVTFTVVKIKLFTLFILNIIIKEKEVKVIVFLKKKLTVFTFLGKPRLKSWFPLVKSPKIVLTDQVLFTFTVT